VLSWARRTTPTHRQSSHGRARARPCVFTMVSLHECKRMSCSRASASFGQRHAVGIRVKNANCLKMKCVQLINLVSTTQKKRHWMAPHRRVSGARRASCLDGCLTYELAKGVPCRAGRVRIPGIVHVGGRIRCFHNLPRKLSTAHRRRRCSNRWRCQGRR
jgi:hypothetical protein